MTDTHPAKSAGDAPATLDQILARIPGPVSLSQGGRAGLESVKEG